MGQAKRRGTYEQRKQEAVELKMRFIRAMQDQQLMRGKTVTGRTPTEPTIQGLPMRPDRVWYDEAAEFDKVGWEAVQGGVLCLDCGWVGYSGELAQKILSDPPLVVCSPYSRPPIDPLGSVVEVCPKCFSSKLGAPYG